MNINSAVIINRLPNQLILSENYLAYKLNIYIFFRNQRSEKEY